MKFEADKTKVGIDLEKVRCYNCNMYGHFSRNCKAPKDTSRYQQNKPPPAIQIQQTIEGPPPKALLSQTILKTLTGASMLLSMILLKQ